MGQTFGLIKNSINSEHDYNAFILGHTSQFCITKESGDYKTCDTETKIGVSEFEFTVLQNRRIDLWTKMVKGGNVY